MIGCLSCDLLADLLGRRRRFWSPIYIIVIIAGALQANSVSISMFIAGRLIGGISSGALVTLVPHIRARLQRSKSEVSGW